MKRPDFSTINDLRAAVELATAQQPKGLWGWARSLFWGAEKERQYQMDRMQLMFLAGARRKGWRVEFSPEAAHITDTATGETWSWDLGPLDPRAYEAWLGSR